MEPRRCSGPGPGLRHRLCHSNVINAEIESVSRDHYVGDDDGHNSSTAIVVVSERGRLSLVFYTVVIARSTLDVEDIEKKKIYLE